MTLLFALIIFFVAAIGLAFYRMSPKIWIPAMGIVLVLVTIMSHFAWVFLVLWLAYIALALIFGSRIVRQRLVTPEVLAFFQKSQPPISATEREALIAGDVWWEGDLFAGKPDWDKLMALEKPSLTSEEQAFIDNQVQVLCAMLDDWAMVREYGDLSPEVWEYLKREGFFGLVIDKTYGGKGFSPYAHSAIVTAIASRSSSAGVAVMVPNALGTGEFIQHYGTPEQKEYYLPRLAQGIEIPAFALTSPVAGSDAAAITDTGVVCHGDFQGERVLGLRLNWNKRYITLAPLATILGLAVKVSDPEHLLGEQQQLGITACLVPTHLPGVDYGTRHYPGGLAFLNGPTRGKDVFIPLHFIIGGADMLGKGWRMLMECLAGGRGISLPAMSVGMAKICYRMTGAYARVREQFRLSVGKLEGVGMALGHMGGLTYLSEATRYFTLSGIHGGVKPALPAAITKYHLTEMARTIINTAMDIHGGRAVQQGPRNYLSFLYQAIPIGITVEGANILTRNLMIFGQGAIRCHPYVRAEIDAAALADPQQRLVTFDRLLCRHLGFAVSNFARTLVYGLTGGMGITVPHHRSLTGYYRQLTRMSTALAFTADMTLAVLGGELKRKECISARLGDILSHLYMASAVLKYFSDQGGPADDLPFVHWSLQHCLAEIQQAFDGLRSNFMPRWLAWLLYPIIFPWGRAYRPPQDTLQLAIAAAMMRPGPQRDRVTAYCYVNQTPNDPTGRMEAAFQAWAVIEPLRAKIQAAQAEGRIPKKKGFVELATAAAAAGILSADELKLVEDYIRLQWDAIQVDEFSSEALSKGGH